MEERPRTFLESNTRIRLNLIRDLAEGKITRTSMARKYECVPSAITEFAKRHADEIKELQGNLENKLFGLWAASKEQRIAAYQATIEQCDREIERALSRRVAVETRDSAGDVYWEALEDVSDVIGRLERARHRALRSIAEERGELPSRVTIGLDDSKKVKHIIEGIDADAV